MHGVYLTHGATKPLCCWLMSDEWFGLALDILKTEGADAWALFLKGA